MAKRIATIDTPMIRAEFYPRWLVKHEGPRHKAELLTQVIWLIFLGPKPKCEMFQIEPDRLRAEFPVGVGADADALRDLRAWIHELSLLIDELYVPKGEGDEKDQPAERLSADQARPAEGQD